MLRAVAIHNFVHYNAHTEVHLEEGANFIIGPNASGKSSFFELIRRCMSRKINHSWSSIRDSVPYAYVVCKYELGNHQYKENQETATTENVNNLLYTGILYDNKTKSYYKICRVFNGNMKAQRETCVDRYTLKTGSTDKTSLDSYGCQTAKFLSEENENNMVFLDGLIDDSSKTSKDVDDSTKTRKGDVVKEIIQSLENIEYFSKGDGYASPCEQILEYVTEKYFIVTFCSQGILPIQWSKSQYMTREHREDNYKKGKDSAEIFRALLTDTCGSPAHKHNSQSTKVDDTQETEIFEILTYPLQFRFWKKDEDIKCSDGPVECHIMKTPMGVLEAKQLSLILAHQEFQTICLEEPDRSMHPSMIERLRDLVLRSEHLKKKTIIILSHNQVMMSWWNIDRIHIFRRPKQNGVIVSKPKTAENFSREDILSVPFASKVLVTEGAGDKEFFKKMIDHLLQRDGVLAEVLESAGITCDDSKIERFKFFLCNLHIIELGGADEHIKVAKFINDIAMMEDTFFVYDNDVVYKTEKNETKEKVVTMLTTMKFQEVVQGIKEKEYSPCKYRYQSRKSLDHLQRKFGHEFVEQGTCMREKLKNKHIFIWDKGNLEDIVRSEIFDSPDRFVDAFTKYESEMPKLSSDPGPSRAKQPKPSTRDIEKFIRMCLSEKIKAKYDRSKAEEKRFLDHNDITFLAEFVLKSSSGIDFLTFLLKWAKKTNT